jgi:prolyl-tRNA synthetase
MKQTVKYDGEHAGTALAKQLFLYDKNKKERMWLISAHVDTEVNMQALEKHLKVKNGGLRGADEGRLSTHLGCVKGMVNYYAILNDTSKAVVMMIDKKLVEAPFASFHPMDCTASTAISSEGIMKIKDVTGRDDEQFVVFDFEELTGGAGASTPAPPKKEKSDKPKVEQGKKMTAEEKKENKQKQKDSRIQDANEKAVQYSKEANFSLWYQDVIKKSELIEYYDISGCYIFRPRSFYIWECIQAFLDKGFKSHGVQNAYFPLFIS